MLALAVDTSTSVVSTALVDVVDDDTCRVLARRDEAAPNRHGELLAALIAAAMAEAQVDTAAVKAVVAGVGPGPFTGLRVGVVTAVTFADALGVPAYGVCSLDAVARAHSGAGPLLVCTDARRRQVYWARYDAAGRRVEGPDLAPPSDLAARVQHDDLLVVGAGVLVHPDAFTSLRVSDDAPFPAAVDVAAVAAPRIVGRAPAERLDPMYLRRPDAVPPARPKSVTPA